MSVFTGATKHENGVGLSAAEGHREAAEDGFLRTQE